MNVAASFMVYDWDVSRIKFKQCGVQCIQKRYGTFLAIRVATPDFSPVMTSLPSVTKPTSYVYASQMLKQKYLSR